MSLACGSDNCSRRSAFQDLGGHRGCFLFCSPRVRTLRCPDHWDSCHAAATPRATAMRVVLLAQPFAPGQDPGAHTCLLLLLMLLEAKVAKTKWLLSPPAFQCPGSASHWQNQIWSQLARESGLAYSFQASSRLRFRAEQTIKWGQSC